MLSYAHATVVSEHLTQQKALCRFISTSAACTQNFQGCHFGKLIQDISLFLTTGKSGLLLLFFFSLHKTFQYLCFACTCAEAEMETEGNSTF